jgi:hypothetical protein
MNYDALLLYISEVGEGNWTQFKRASAAVQCDAAIAARVLSALGHAEFAWDGEARWAVCPPALSALPRQPQPAVILCGQRPPALLEDMRAAAARLELGLTEHPQAGGPSVIQISAARADMLEQLADDLRVRLSPHAAEYLASSLPSLDTLVATSPACARPVVPPIAAFDPATRQWLEVSQISGDGLYEYENFYPDYRLLLGGQWRLVGKEIGIYSLLDPSAWTYIPERQDLRIGARLLPPPLYQRALVLCSGYLATFDGADRHWVYRDVPPAIVGALGRKLKQSV